MRVGSLFSGIGGLDLGLERAGMSVAWQCEIDPYCRAVLAHHWPGVKCYDDIRAIDDTAERVDLICGGFPCQPVSLAGKGLAQEDPRWLWPEFARVVGLLRPRYVLVENVPGLVRRGLADVIGDLAALGYDAEWQIVSAASVGAPHLRERIIVVAYPGGEQYEGGSPSDERPTPAGLHEAALADSSSERRQQDVADSDSLLLDWGGAFRQERRAEPSDSSSGAGDVQNPNSRDGQSVSFSRPGICEEVGCQRADGDTRGAGSDKSGWWSVEPEVGRVAHGVPNRVAQLRALGNAVVPQVAEFVGRLILEAEGAARAA